VGLLDYILLLELAAVAILFLYAAYVQVWHRITWVDFFDKESKNHKRSRFITKVMMALGVSLALTMVVYESIHGPYEYSEPAVPVVE
jgi:hypothetical protein